MAHSSDFENRRLLALALDQLNYWSSTALNQGEFASRELWSLVAEAAQEVEDAVAALASSGPPGARGSTGRAST